VNPIQGEAPLLLGSETYTLVYDWRALAVMAQAVGSDPNLFDPETLACVLVTGLARYHSSMTASDIFDASPPMAAAVADFNNALRTAYYGHREPPQKDDTGGVSQPDDTDRLEQIAKVYATAFRAGISPADFWSLTPFQTGLMVEANAEAMQDEFDKLIAAGWHTAVFSRAKTIPPLKTLFPPKHDPTRISDDDNPDQIAAKRMIAAMMGATKTKSISFQPEPPESSGDPANTQTSAT
jgi:hypothetical protein